MNMINYSVYIKRHEMAHAVVGGCGHESIRRNFS